MIAPPMGRTAFVSGAAGVMGSRLCRDLVGAGWKVRALILPGDPLRSRLDGLGCEIHEGDIGSPESLRGACDGVDTVYHLAAVIISHDPSVYQRVNLDGTRHMVAAAAAASVRHLIYVSSASVIYPRRTPYAESKLAAEELVKAERSFAHTIVRPTLVYDVGGGQELLMFLDYLRRFPVVPFVGAGRARKRPVWSGRRRRRAVAPRRQPRRARQDLQLQRRRGDRDHRRLRPPPASSSRRAPFLRAGSRAALPRARLRARAAHEAAAAHGERHRRDRQRRRSRSGRGDARSRLSRPWACARGSPAAFPAVSPNAWSRMPRRESSIHDLAKTFEFPAYYNQRSPSLSLALSRAPAPRS